MDEQGSYVDQLEELLKTKTEQLDHSELKTLGENCRIFQSGFKGLFGILYKKGIIHDDPYKYEIKISEVTVPPESPFSENEKIDQMSIRLSQYDASLDFLNNYYQFSVDFLSMGRIKRLVALIKYFTFTQFSETSQQINTRCFAELVNLVRKGTDPISTGLIGESLGILDKASRDIFKTLKILTLIHKENYKMALRRLIMPGLKIDPERAITHREEIVRQVKRKAQDVLTDKPFYPELVEEILSEDFSSEGINLKDEITKQLYVDDGLRKESVKEKNFKNVILDGIRIIVGSGHHIHEAAQRLADNSMIIQNLETGFWFSLKRVFARFFNAEEKIIEYELDYLDPVSGIRKEEKIDFTAFINGTMRRAQLYTTMVSRNSTAYMRISSAPEEQAYAFLEKSVEEVQNFHRKLYALDEYFKALKLEPDVKPRIRGIKNELEAMRNAIIKANQKKHEYVGQKEEIEQMKRLGIKTT